MHQLNNQTKKRIEKKFGIPFEEFCDLDPEVIDKLIETKIGKKLKPDYRPIVDGIPIDDKNVITRKQIDKQFIKILKKRK